MGFFERAGEPMAFVDWMSQAIPLILVMLPISWLLLCAPLFGKRAATSSAMGQVVRSALEKLGPISMPEIRIGVIFGLVALAWMFRVQLNEWPPLAKLSDTSIAVIGALTLFLVPSGRKRGEKLIDWTRAERIPWGIAILFGGGLSLAAAMETTGLAQWIGAWIVSLEGLSTFGLIVILVLTTILVSELASNVATLTSMLPVVAAIAEATGTPLQTLVFPVAIAASFAFMLPVATGPNAIAFSSGVVTLKRMLVVGFALNIAAATAIIALFAA
jgi:sodium-dependent dicarboxylate transporter 2/3/5